MKQIFSILHYISKDLKTELRSFLGGVEKHRCLLTGSIDLPTATYKEAMITISTREFSFLWILPVSIRLTLKSTRLKRVRFSYHASIHFLYFFIFLKFSDVFGGRELHSLPFLLLGESPLSLLGDFLALLPVQKGLVLLRVALLEDGATEDCGGGGCGRGNFLGHWDLHQVARGIECEGGGDIGTRWEDACLFPVTEGLCLQGDPGIRGGGHSARIVGALGGCHCAFC